MSRVATDVSSNGSIIHIEVLGEEDIARALGDLRSKTPAVMKVAINATVREARKLEIQHSKARYALTAKGQEHLKELKQHKRATNTSLSADLRIASLRSDMAYFQHRPTTVYTGRAVLTNAPPFVKGHNLKSTPMTPLTGKGNLSKAFLAQFASGHIGMVQRIEGSSSKHTITRKGAPRWRNAAGNVEKLQTMGAPSGAAMHHTVWPEVQPTVEEYLLDRTVQQIDKVIARAKARAKVR